MIYACSCLCGSAEPLIRTALKDAGYRDPLGLIIHQGRDKSLALLEILPRGSEENQAKIEMLERLIRDESSWAVVVGVKGNMLDWVNINRGGEKARIKLELMVGAFDQ